jgi:hypothetical protein
VLKDDLKQTNKKFDFAITVIDKIRGRLVEEPEFCEALLDYENLLTKNPELVNQLISNLSTPLALIPEKALALKNALDAKL